MFKLCSDDRVFRHFTTREQVWTGWAVYVWIRQITHSLHLSSSLNVEQSIGVELQFYKSLLNIHFKWDLIKKISSFRIKIISHLFDFNKIYLAVIFSFAEAWGWSADMKVSGCKISNVLIQFTDTNPSTNGGLLYSVFRPAFPINFAGQNHFMVQRSVFRSDKCEFIGLRHSTLQLLH